MHGAASQAVGILDVGLVRLVVIGPVRSWHDGIGWQGREGGNETSSRRSRFELGGVEHRRRVGGGRDFAKADIAAYGSNDGFGERRRRERIREGLVCCGRIGGWRGKAGGVFERRRVPEERVDGQLGCVLGFGGVARGGCVGREQSLLSRGCEQVVSILVEHGENGSPGGGVGQQLLEGGGGHDAILDDLPRGSPICKRLERSARGLGRYVEVEAVDAEYSGLDPQQARAFEQGLRGAGFGCNAGDYLVE